MDQASVYNAIIGRPLMKKTKMVSSVYYLMINFPTPMGIGFVRANQLEARSFHLLSLDLVPKNLAIDVIEIKQLKNNNITL